MKKVREWVLPDSDTHFQHYLEKRLAAGLPCEYQKPHRDKAMSYCLKRDVAIDVGAHVGLWSRPMSDVFGEVLSFEPLEHFRELLAVYAPNAKIYPFALGNSDSVVEFEIPPDNSGMAHIMAGSEGGGQIPIRKLDSFKFAQVDFIKIDCERYEYPVLQGAVETLSQSRPVIVVEQKPNNYFAKDWDQYAAVRFLVNECAYNIVDRIVDDWILAPRDA